MGAGSSQTRGVFGGGHTSGDTIDYITIASTGNASDFGNLNSGDARYKGGTSTFTRAVFGGGQLSSTRLDAIDYITIASTGNASDFGNLTVGRNSVTATSGAHGGIS